MFKSGINFNAEFSLKPAEGDLKGLGYMTIEDVEDPGSSVVGGMNPQNWAIYRSNWLAASKMFPEGGLEGQTEFIKANPTEEYPGDVVHEDGFINIYQGAHSVLGRAQTLVDDLNNYPVIDEDMMTQLEDECLDEEIDNWAMDDAKDQLGYGKDWADLLTDDEASWLAKINQEDPQQYAKVEQQIAGIFSLTPDTEPKMRTAVRDGLIYGDWTVVHIKPVIESLKEQGVEALAHPDATMHQFLKTEMGAGTPGSAEYQKRAEEAGQQRLFESLKSAQETVAGIQEIKAMVLAGNSVTRAKSVANMVAKIVGGHNAEELEGGGFFTYPVKGHLMAALFTAHDDSFGVAWAPVSFFASVKDAAKSLSAKTMLSFDNTTKLRVISNAMTTVKAAGNRFGVWNAYDEIPAYPEPFATEEEAMAAAMALKERVKEQGFWKSSSGYKIPYEGITVATHAENPDAGILVVPETDNPEAFNEIWGGEEEVEAGLKAKRARGPKSWAKGLVGNSDDIGPAKLKAQNDSLIRWIQTQGFQQHAGQDTLCTASRARLGFWATTPKGFEPVVKELKHQKSVKNPWAVAWSMKNKGIKPKAAKIEAGKAKGRFIVEQLVEDGPWWVLELGGGNTMNPFYGPFDTEEDATLKLDNMVMGSSLIKASELEDLGSPEWDWTSALEDLGEASIGMGYSGKDFAEGIRALLSRKDIPTDFDVSSLEALIPKLESDEDGSVEKLQNILNGIEIEAKKKMNSSKIKAEGGTEVIFNYVVDEDRGSGQKGVYELRFYAENPVSPEVLSRFEKLATDDLVWAGYEEVPGYEEVNHLESIDKAYEWSVEAVAKIVAALEAEFGAENVDLTRSSSDGEGSVTVRIEP